MGLSDLKPCEWAQNILFQVAETWKEMLLGSCERDRFTEFQLQKFHSAHEVCNLKESVSVRCDVLHKDGIETAKCRLEHLRNLRLPVVIVDFDSVVSFQTVCGGREELRHLERERADHCVWRVAIAFVKGKDMVFNRRMERKSKKAEEKLLANMNVHEAKTFLAADERPSMNTGLRHAEVGELGMHFIKMARQVVTLVMKDERDNVEAGWDNRRIEASRFVHKYAQFLCAIHADKKLAGRYPRRRVARAFASAKMLMPQTPRIVANRGCGCNGGSAVFFFRRAA